MSGQNHKLDCERKSLILGAGVTGLAAGWISRLPIYEAGDRPGGICVSYYKSPGKSRRFETPAARGTRYRFETGGGHWLFGANRSVRRFIGRQATLERYVRRSAVFFPRSGSLVPFPLQAHLEGLGPEIKKKFLGERGKPSAAGAPTMKGWLERSFGRTLCDLFFYGFHDLYTAGLYREIAPQDVYKTPPLSLRASLGNKPRRRSYNDIFYYPKQGLDRLVSGLASGCRIRYRKKAVRIDGKDRRVFFSDGTSVFYDKLLSTAPLSETAVMAGVSAAAEVDPHTSVLVVNIGAVRGDRCPESQWLYLPDNDLGFFRVGFYSNVEAGFLPKCRPSQAARVGLYVERAFLPGCKPSAAQLACYEKKVIARLKAWGFIGEVEAIDRDWIPVAYTWSRPGSRWREAALEALEQRGIYPIGRYGRWHFQGIADSMAEGLRAGRKFSGRR